MPLARIEWRPVESDERTFRAAIRRLGEYWRRHNLDNVSPLRWTPEAIDEAQPIAATAAELAHPSGTTRLGQDPRLSVVDPELRCHIVRNLTVVSASVFPTAGSTGPTFTLLQLAMRTADQLMTRVR